MKGGEVFKLHPLSLCHIPSIHVSYDSLAACTVHV